MFDAIAIDYPGWTIAACLALGAVFAGALYWRDRSFPEAGPTLRRMLPLFALLRFVAISAIALLLLDPLLRSQFSETEKPLILVAEDDSESLANALDSAQLALFSERLNAQIADLERDFEVYRWHFGESLEEGPAVDHNDRSTDFTAALDGLYGRYANRNVGAVILTGDGVYNVGSNPLYRRRRIAAPIYSVALGDTAERRDLRIGRVLHNRIVYLGDRFKVGVEMDARFADGMNTRLIVDRISSGGTNRVHESNLRIEGDAWQGEDQFVLPADEAGIAHYRLRLQAVEGESGTINNVADIFVEVLDARQKILLLAHAPHPDLAALRRILERNTNYEVQLAFANNFAGLPESYSLVILHQLPSRRFPLAEFVERMQAQGIPRFFVVGSATDPQALNSSQELLRLIGARGGSNEIRAALREEFTLFTIPQGLSDDLKRYPPLRAPFGEYTLSPGADALLDQQIGAVRTNFPLLVFDRQGTSRTGILAAEGIWRWRLFEYQQTGEHLVVDELVNKAVQFLAVKSDKRPFRTLVEKSVYNEQENVQFRAELYNASFEPVNDPEVALSVTDAEGLEYTFRFNRIENAYALDAGAFPPGDYTYRATTQFAGEAFAAAGKFTVSPLRLEAMRSRADFGLMRSLASSSGGTLVDVTTVDGLAESIRENAEIRPVIRERSLTRSIINLRMIFFFFLGLLALEWFLRKLNGAY